MAWAYIKSLLFLFTQGLHLTDLEGVWVVVGGESMRLYYYFVVVAFFSPFSIITLRY